MYSGNIKRIDKHEDSHMHRVLDLALKAGRISLSNGAEIFRVEETIEYICRHFGIEEMDAFVLSNGIFLTAYSGGHEVYARVKHVPSAGTHLGIVEAVNDLSREITAGHVTIEEALVRLEEIDKIPAKSPLSQVIAAGIGSAAFCLLMRNNVYDAFFTIFIAGLLQAGLVLAGKAKISKIITNILGGVFITVCAIGVTSIPWPFKVNLDNIIIGCIMPLIPGVLFVNAIRDVSSSDFISGIVKLIDALLVFVYIAVGVGCALSAYNDLMGGVILTWL